MSNKKIAYCGDCCIYCPRYIATLSGSSKKLNEVKREIPILEINSKKNTKFKKTDIPQK